MLNPRFIGIGLPLLVIFRALLSWHVSKRFIELGLVQTLSQIVFALHLSIDQNTHSANTLKENSTVFSVVIVDSQQAVIVVHEDVGEFLRVNYEVRTEFGSTSPIIELLSRVLILRRQLFCWDIWGKHFYVKVLDGEMLVRFAIGGVSLDF